METYRVLSNKKIIFTVIVILIVNLVLSFALENQNVKNQSGAGLFTIKNALSEINVGAMSDDEIENNCSSLETIILLNAYYVDAESTDEDEAAFALEAINELRESHPESAQWFDENKDNLDLDSIRAFYYIYNQELEKREYLNTYSTYLTDTITTSENISQLSIFKNSYSQKSFEILAADYNELGKLQLQNTNTTAFQLAASNNVTNVLLVLLVLVLCMALFYNKDKNIDIIVRTCKNGRAQLFFSRLGVSVFIILACVIGLFAENFIMYGFFYGYDLDMNAAVQCSELFKSFLGTVSFAQYALIFFCLKTAALIVVFLITYLLLCVLSDINTLCICLVLFSAVQYLFYKYIAVYSTFSILHMANIISFLNDTQWVNYGMFNFFGTPVRIFTGETVLLAIILLCLILINALVSQLSYTIHTKNRLQLKINRFSQKLMRAVAAVQDKLMSGKGEYFKLFVSQKFILVLLIAGAVFFNTYSFGYIAKQPVEAYLDDFYARYSGELTETTSQKIDELGSMLEGTQENLAELEEQYSNGEISFDEYYAQANKYASNETAATALAVIEEQVDYIISQESRGVKAFLIDETGFNNLFSVENSQNSSVPVVIFLLILLFLTHGLTAKDKNKNIACLLRSTINGRRRLLKTKLNMGFISATAVYLVWTLTEIIYNKYYFNLDNWSAPVQSIEALADFPLNINILTFTVLYYLTRYIVLISIFYIFIAVNMFTENKSSLIINFVLFILPCLLSFLGFDLISDYSVVGILGFMQHFLSNSAYLQIYAAISVLLLAVAVFLKALMLKTSEKRGESL
ncbi:MAG: hypothetical protein LUH82_04880 [Clostridiales bacterium]|nr:hypothetical protein [Clostridiales bacterium]